jgi:hypothetical protein
MTRKQLTIVILTGLNLIAHKRGKTYTASAMRQAYDNYAKINTGQSRKTKHLHTSNNYTRTAYFSLTEH